MDTLNSNKPNLDLGAGSKANVTQHQTITNQETMGPAPRFLIVKRKEGDFNNTNPFLIQKFIYGKVGEVKNLKKIKDGLLIETKSAAQSKVIVGMKKFLEYDIEVLPHNRLNYAKGVINCRDLLNCTEQEILDEIKDQGILEVRRIKSKQNGILVDTPNHIVTFNSTNLPKEVRVAFYQLKVRPYIPSPLRCFRCQRFGHTAIKCTKDQVCVCGKPIHTGNPCSPPVSCINCQGSHAATSKDCPIFKQEVAIQEVKIKENLSYFEAKKKVVINTPKPNFSYAKASASSSIPPPQTFKPQDLIKDLIPVLINALKSNFTIVPISHSSSIPLSSNLSNMLPPKEPSQESNLSQMSKRGRSDSSDLDSNFSETSCKSQTTTKRKKKGWPKGMPRKGSVESDIGNEILKHLPLGGSESQ
ncbi:unnamed protein product [Psylliodes chrysocephalus]|uniref:CCHC-type domain-containing protein n=1 Tax=Psylliodes chrysocephalus TaxID=3402493 RepID=A0A9P0CXS7_9CUCU|nr:unnamed protein product [Psylliodes chrysocephala]